jgi:hypothetical protein
MGLHHNDRGLWVVIFILLILFVGNFIFTQYEISQLRSSNSSVTKIISPSTNQTETSDTCRTACQTYVNNAIAKLNLATPLASGKPSATTKPSPIPNTMQTTYVPLSGGSTQNTDWTTIPSSQFSFNITDYGTKANAIWDANLHVDNANGTTFARIYDTTHNIAVNGSEINISNTNTSTDVVSGSLQFWQGNNTYVVQIKSLNSSTAFIDSGRIKITY